HLGCLDRPDRADADPEHLARLLGEERRAADELLDGLPVELRRVGELPRRTGHADVLVELPHAAQQPAEAQLIEQTETGRLHAAASPERPPPTTTTSHCSSAPSVIVAAARAAGHATHRTTWPPRPRDAPGSCRIDRTPCGLPA